MWRHISANLWLAGLTLLLGSVLYPLALYGIGQTLFPFQAQGSLLDKEGHPTTDPAKAVGSRLIGQPFSRDEYFQPRPSATSPAYNAAASSGSNLSASSYQLRDRVARALGPIAKYSGGPKKGQLVGPDVERWFREDRYQGKPGIVARWASDHGIAGQNWVPKTRRLRCTAAPCRRLDQGPSRAAGRMEKRQSGGGRAEARGSGRAVWRVFPRSIPANGRRSSSKNGSSWSARGAISKPVSSTYGGKNIQRPSWKKCRPIW